MLNEIKTAVENIEWQYVTLSRLRYGGTHSPVEVGDFHWLERPFAYEIYHQLRCHWHNERLETSCVIQAEVYKKYQSIRDVRKMPDFLFHAPNSERNLAVVEIKLASNHKKKLEDDLNKLSLFYSALHYDSVIEILIGYDSELIESHSLLDKWDGTGATPIDILTLSLDNHRTNVGRIKYRNAE